MSYWIRQLDPVHSVMSHDLAKITKDLLSYTCVYYRDSLYRKVRKEYTKTTIIGTNKEGKLFYTGLIPKIKKFCADHVIHLTCEQQGIFTTRTDPELPEGVILRHFQKDLIHTAIVSERGVLKAPTGTGKTVLGLALVASIDDLNGVLWLCHTKDLMYQTKEEAIKFFGEDAVGTLGDGTAVTDKFLTVATRQTFKDYADRLGTTYDMVILDEVHHLSSFSGEYATILKKVTAPFRIGLTATLPTSQEALLAMESLIGPLIGEMTINEGREQGFMANPKIKIVKIPTSHRVKEIRKYADVYEFGVVRRLERNRIIVDLVKKHEELGDSVLVVVTKITHGELLLSLCQHSGVEAIFVRGSTDAENRELTKKALNNKVTKCVICTAVWKEGVNIPELNVVINAAGGKSEIMTLQSIGRGLRKTDEKKDLIIYDFFDNSHHHIISHFGERFSLYCDMDWI